MQKIVPEGEQAQGSARNYCSEQNAQEPMWGTAEQVDCWLMLEYRPAWKPKAVQENELSDATGIWLNTSLQNLAEAGLKARAQFIRQPEVDSAETRLLIVNKEMALEFSGVGYDFLQGLDLVAIAADPASFLSLARQITQPQYFVCTNGQRDRCCARFGLPVYSALREHVGARAWQITHLGGHRFAPNVLVLPDALMYGRVSAETVDDFLVETEQGMIDFSRLRGRACYASIVQAAEACLQLPEIVLQDVRGDDDAAMVTFVEPGTGSRAETLHQVEVKRADRPLSVLKSCNDEEEKPVYHYLATRLADPAS